MLSPQAKSAGCVDTRKVEVLHLRCSAEEKARWREFAEAKHVHLSVYVRLLLNALVDQDAKQERAA